MPHHVIVDGSNLATEGRPLPSLKQLNDVVMAFMEEQPAALITVVVDATFGHRINSSEVAEFDAAIANNELVAPPAGAIGRGDAFLLSIANKVGATVLSNDSFQEFHGTYPWLFEEGRLIGGKPVPHIGWVFVARSPVRGPISRSSVKEARRKKDGGTSAPAPAAAAASTGPGRGSRRGGGKRQTSVEASLPMPVPKAPPPNAARPSSAVNDFTSFLSFVEHHPVGTSVNATVENYSSHGAYVKLDGGVVGYVPLRLMGDPPPRSAREFLKIGDSVTLVVESFAPSRRSIDLAMTSMAIAKPATPAKRSKKAAAAEPPPEKTTKRAKKAAPAEPAPVPEKKTRAKKAAPAPSAEAVKKSRAKKAPAPEAAQPVKRSRAKKTEPIPVEPAAENAASIDKAPPARRPRKRASN